MFVDFDLLLELFLLYLSRRQFYLQEFEFFLDVCYGPLGFGPAAFQLGWFLQEGSGFLPMPSRSDSALHSAVPNQRFQSKASSPLQPLGGKGIIS